MAHADYNCCMICDCKMEYNSGDAETKEKPCLDCIARMRDAGVMLLDPKEFTDHLEHLPQEKRQMFLAEIGYSKCFYLNPLDEAVKRLTATAT